jgi:purine-nucleoside phosphorylase
MSAHPDAGAGGQHVSAHGAAAARVAADSVRASLEVRAPVAAIVLGTGLGDLAARIEDAVGVRYADIPGFHAPKVQGHRGELIRGTLAGREVLAFAGRLHMYEGYDAPAAAFPVRVAHALGARVLFVANAAGGIRRSFAPGDLMVIEDHLNLVFRNPLIGPVESTDERFPDMSAPWSPRLIALLRECAKTVGVPLQSGVYAGLLGPSYETPAEIRMLSLLGADAVGMSTVPEAIVGAALKMEVVGISVITNAAAGVGERPLSHAEVVEAGERARFSELAIEFVSRL